MLMAQNANLKGAFLAKEGKINHLWLFIDGYSSYIQYEDDKYLGTWGGPFSVVEGKIKVNMEFNDQKPDEVGSIKMLETSISKDQIKYGNLDFKRQTPKKLDLDGLWRITGRKQDDKLSEIARGDRKTIKLLVDGHFQWIAINPTEKGFFGTGGGHYTFKDKKYTEHILFFSRDNSRVDAHLEFTGELKDGKWHHSGLSSKGDPIYEIWSRDK